MDRKQIYLDHGSNERLKKLAGRKGVSEASLIREAVNSYLAKLEEEETGAGADNPLLRLTGMYEGDIPADAAIGHDRYLYCQEER